MQMKEQKRKGLVFAVLFSVCLLFTLAACGQQTARQPASQPAQSAGVESEPPAESISPSAEPTVTEEETGTLVVYFSATGNTKAVAGYIAEELGADTYEIVPAEPYSSDDLNYNNDSSRVSVEHQDPDFRPALGGGELDLSVYDTVFLGYPLWWGQAPHVVLTFLESYDWTGKTVIPFCTSASSGLGDSDTNLHDNAPGAAWLKGQRFSGSAGQEEAVEWLNNLTLE